MGLPVEKFILSTNENDEVPEFLRTGIYKSIVPSVNCISSAMNVGHPSNLSRIVALFDGMMDEAGIIHKEPDMMRMRDELFGISVRDDETRETIARIFSDFGILLEPHGAIAWHGVNEYLRLNKTDDGERKLCISLETAHPAKFPEELRQIIKIEPPLPHSLAGLEGKTENYITLDNNYEMVRNFILKHN